MIYKSFALKTEEGNRLKYIKLFFASKNFRSLRKSQSSKSVLAE